MWNVSEFSNYFKFTFLGPTSNLVLHHSASSHIIPHLQRSWGSCKSLGPEMAREPFWQRYQRLWHEGVVPLRPSLCSATGLGLSWDHLGTILGCFASHLSGLAWRSSPIWMLRATSSRRMRRWLAMTGDDYETMNFPVEFLGCLCICIPWYPSLCCLAS